MDIFTLVVNWAQILALPVAVIAIIVSVVLYHRSRERRALDCQFQSIEFPIEIKADEAFKGDLKILYKDNPIENLFLIRARLKNTGNVPILASEVVQPVTFDVDPDTKLMQHPKLTNERPASLKMYWKTPSADETVASTAEGEMFVLAFDLLNPGDEFTAEFLCTGKVVLPKVAARIEGISEIGVLDPTEIEMQKELASTKWDILGFSFLVAVVGGLAYLLWKVYLEGTIPYPPNSQEAQNPELTWDIVLFGVGLFMIGISTAYLAKVVRLERKRKRKS